MILYSSIVSRDELVSAEGSLYPHLGSARHAHVEPDVAVAITILDKVLQTNLHDRLALLGRDLIPRVHGRVIARECSKRRV